MTSQPRHSHSTAAPILHFNTSRQVKFQQNQNAKLQYHRLSHHCLLLVVRAQISADGQNLPQTKPAERAANSHGKKRRKKDRRVGLSGLRAVSEPVSREVGGDGGARTPKFGTLLTQTHGRSPERGQGPSSDCSGYSQGTWASSQTVSRLTVLSGKSRGSSFDTVAHLFI